MRLIICGGRDFVDHELFHQMIARWIAEYGWPSEIIEGGASGADAMAREWAQAQGIKHTQFKADWTRWGKKAGPLRNAAMARYACDGVRGGCLGLPGGRGTADMLLQARTSGLDWLSYGRSE